MRAHLGGALFALLCGACVSQQTQALCKPVSECLPAGTYDPMCYSSQATACDANNCPKPNGVCGTTLSAEPLALTGCPMADYVGVIRVGDQNFAVIMDSGSTTLALAANNCNNCTGINPLYSPNTTAQDENMRASSVYGNVQADATGWEAEVFSDQVFLSAANTNVTMRLAAITSQQNFFEDWGCSNSATVNGMQGLMGLGPSPLAVTGTDSYVANLATTAGVPQAFSVALCNESGSLWFGGYDPNVLAAPVQFTPKITTPVPFDRYYAVTIADMFVGGTSLGFNAADYGPTVVDTGTTELILPQVVAGKLGTILSGNAAFNSAFGTELFTSASACGQPLQGQSREQLDATLPTFVVSFPGKGNAAFNVELPATSSYLAPQLNGTSTPAYCLTIAGQPGGFTIFGNTLMRSQVVVFDATDQQIGFAPQASGVCPTTG